jgi:hypothetical protein
LTTLDTLLLDEGTPYGPVVAIGNPTDKLPPYGAARGFFTNQTWQRAVLDLAERSRAIVICVDDFEGIWWEIENVAAHYLDKTLILLHPKYAHTPDGESLSRRITERLWRDPRSAAIRLAVSDKLVSPLGFAFMGSFIDRGHAVQAVRSGTFSQLAYLIAVRRFFRSKWGLVAK